MMIVYRWRLFVNTRCRFGQACTPSEFVAVALVDFMRCCVILLYICYGFWIQGTLLEKPMTDATISLSVARCFYPLPSHAAGGKASLASFASAMRVAMV